MKIAMIMYNLWEAGGVNTISSGLINGFQRAGHEVDYYHVSPNGKLRGLDKTRVVGSRYIRLKAEQIGYSSEIDVSRFRKIVEDNYDFVIFSLPCPHQTKSSYGDDRDWQRLYRLNKPIFVIFHDNLWDKYYRWLEEVSDNISGCLYTVTNAAKDSLTKFPAKRFMFLPVLLDTSQAVFHKKRNGKIVWLPQQKKWKGFVEFIEDAHNLKYPVDMYNIGIMYYDLKKKRNELWRTAVRRDYYAKHHPGTGDYKLNSEAMIDFHGLVLPTQIPSILEQANCSVDLTGMVGGDRFKGQITCSMLEPMMYGCVSVVDGGMVEKEFSLLYGHDDIVWPISNKNEIAKRINKLMSHKIKRRKIAKAAYKYVKRNHDSKMIVEDLLIPFMEKCSRKSKVNESIFEQRS
jgi:glycosyltransferase involved in cell wall biosynthesis